MSRQFDGTKLTWSSPRLTRPSVTAPSQVWPKIKPKLHETCCVNPYGARESWGRLAGVMCDSVEAHYWRNQSFMTCSKRFVNNVLQHYHT